LQERNGRCVDVEENDDSDFTRRVHMHRVPLPPACRKKRAWRPKTCSGYRWQSHEID
jgi:hypothetical protein